MNSVSVVWLEQAQAATSAAPWWAAPGATVIVGLLTAVVAGWSIRRSSRNPQAAIEASAANASAQITASGDIARQQIQAASDNAQKALEAGNDNVHRQIEAADRNSQRQTRATVVSTAVQAILKPETQADAEAHAQTIIRAARVLLREEWLRVKREATGEAPLSAAGEADDAVMPVAGPVG